jgi:hypothetical protein
MRGEDDYFLAFTPWFWQPEYRKPVPDGFALTADEQEYQTPYGLDPEQIVWRRAKIAELKEFTISSANSPRRLPRPSMPKCPVRRGDANR